MSYQFKEATVRYCLRLLDQANLKPGGDSGSQTKTAKVVSDYPDVVLVEAIRLLDLICKLDSAQVREMFLVLLPEFLTLSVGSANISCN